MTPADVAKLIRGQVDAIEREGGGWFSAENLRGYHEPVNADHIAAWSPPVALAAADLVECPCQYHADAFARVYLEGVVS
jgi:hypothetical protein